MNDLNRPAGGESLGDVVAALSQLPPVGDVTGSSAAHLAVLFETSTRALDVLHRGDGAEAVRVLLAGGRLEEQAGRRTQARAWYEAARRIGEQLGDHGLPVEVMQALREVPAAP